MLCTTFFSLLMAVMALAMRSWLVLCDCQLQHKLSPRIQANMYVTRMCMPHVGQICRWKLTSATAPKSMPLNQAL